MSVSTYALVVLSAFAAGCATAYEPVQPDAAEYLLLEGAAVGDVTEHTSMVTARIVDTDDPIVHAALQAEEGAADDVLATLFQSQGTRVVACPSVVVLPGEEGSVAVGESIRFAQTRMVPGPDGPTFTIDESPESPRFVGYELALTPSTPAPDGTLRVVVAFRQSELGGLLAEVPEQSVTLRPDQVAILPVETIVRFGRR